MLEEIAKNIYKVVITFPGGMGDVNSYLVKGKRGYTVVDTGMYAKESLDIWKKLLDTEIIVEKVVLTHTHQDHIGLARWFQQEVGVPVIVSAMGYEEMKRFGSQNNMEKLIALLGRHGGPDVSIKMGDDSFIYQFVPNDLFENHEHMQLGDEIYEAIWTPGHAPDHFCFYNRKDKIMLLGDHILKEISPVIGLWSGDEANPLADYLQALDTIADFPSEIALPGHGKSVFQLTDRARRIKQKHLKRLAEVLEMMQHGPKSAYEVCQEMYGTINIRLQLSSFMATLTRLLYLEEEGKIRRNEIDGVVMFQSGSKVIKI